MRFASAFIFLFFSFTVFSQNVFFETTFGSGFPDLARSVKQMDDSSVYVAGFSIDTISSHSDAKLYKLDRFGNLRWTRTYSTPLDDNAFFVEKTSDSNLLVCGEIQTPSNGLDGFLYKTDTAGTIIWQKFYGGSLNESINRVTELANGNLLLVGYENVVGNSNDFLVIITDSAGNQISSSNIGGSGNDIGMNLLALADSGFLVTGDTRTFNSNDNNVEVMRFDKNGFVIWDSIYGDTLQNGCQGILKTSDGNFLFYGETEIAPSSAFEIFMQKIDMNGNTLWRKTFGGVNADAGFSLVETNNGFIGTGYSSSLFPGPISVVVFKTDTGGNVQWETPYGGPGIDIGYEIIPALGGGFFIIATSNVSGDDQCYLLHVDDGGWANVTENDLILSPEIFPNPNNGSFYFQVPGNEKNGTLAVFSEDGRLVYSAILSENETLVCINENLPAGFYLVRFIGNSGCYSAKILVR